MAKKIRIPSYRFHKASRQAVVVLDGKSTYLGGWDTAESRAEYERVIAEWLAERRHPRGTDTGAANPTPTVNEVILAFWQHAEKHYRHADGTPTGELDNFRDALRPLRRLYGPTSARDFGPKALRAVQQALVDTGLARATINARIRRIRHVFRWATSVEMLPVAIIQALETVPPLQRGRCDAPESRGVHPVSWEQVEAVLPSLPRPVAAIVNLMRYSNCRAEDAVIMRACDLYRESDVWTYRPDSHKNAWRGHQRLIYLGPQAQEVLRPFLGGDPQAYLFSPRLALEEHHAQRRARRKTRRTPSELRRKRKRPPRWTPRARYDVNSLQQAVRRSCRKVGVSSWSVLQLRHTRATEVRERYGVEGAQASLGNARVETAQIYAERNSVLAERIAREIG
jgi:integrase